jgi:hypothetical protein
VFAQAGLFDEEGRRVGYGWSHSSRSGDLIMVRNQTVLHARNLPHGVTTPAVRIDLDLNYHTYHGRTGLDELRLQVFGLGVALRLDGQFYPPESFACEWQVGPRRGHFVLPERATRSIGDVIQPFESLTGLVVGQSWRIELVNPLASVIPAWDADDIPTHSLLVRVTGVEQVAHRGGLVEAFVVEAEKIRAWVTPEGRVIRQEVELPLFGKLSLVDEPYDDEVRQRALRVPLTN